jgi:predicted transcriptional regulator
VSQLVARTGRAQPNVSRSLQLLARHGLIRLEREGKEVRPVALARSIDVDLAAGTYTAIGEARQGGKPPRARAANATAEH